MKMFIRCDVTMTRDDVWLQVSAEDPDRGANGNVTYSLVKSSQQQVVRFTIDPHTGPTRMMTSQVFSLTSFAFAGVLRTAEMFEREGRRGVSEFGVTVRAEDQGRPSLAGFCSFRVEIGDVNDNAPVFDLPSYSTSVQEDSVIGQQVLQVFATDRDAGSNARIHYRIVSDSLESGFFRIDEDTGWIKVASAMSGVSNLACMLTFLTPVHRNVVVFRTDQRSAAQGRGVRRWLTSAQLHC